MPLSKFTIQFALLYPNAQYNTPYGTAKLWAAYPQMTSWDFEIERLKEVKNISINDVRPLLYSVTTLTQAQRQELYYRSGFVLSEEGLDYSINNTKCTPEQKRWALSWLRKNNFDVDSLIEKDMAQDANLSRVFDLMKIPSTPLYMNEQQQALLFSKFPDLKIEGFRKIQKSGWLSAIDRVHDLLGGDECPAMLLGVLQRARCEYEYFFNSDIKKSLVA